MNQRRRRMISEGDWNRGESVVEENRGGILERGSSWRKGEKDVLEGVEVQGEEGVWRERRREGEGSSPGRHRVVIIHLSTPPPPLDRRSVQSPLSDRYAVEIM
jgi:hypothetical protein